MTYTELAAKSGRVMESIGRCLIVYQRIEVLLKYLLPHVVGQSQIADDTFGQWRSLLDSKATLGPLVERLRESVRAADPDGFNHYVEKLVAQRNELVHHFSRLPFGRINNIEQCDAALAYLDGCFEFALPLHDALMGMSEQFIDALVEWKLSET